MITLETLDDWLSAQEDEHLDFKVAKDGYSREKLFEYCVAFANECGGRLILGVSEVTKVLRKVVGTNAFLNLNETKSLILEKLHYRVEIYELHHPDGRVLIFDVPSRPIGQPQHLDGRYLMRSGEDLVPMSQDQLRRIITEQEPDWFTMPAKSGISADQVIGLLDTQIYFDLLKLPYPSTRDKVLDRMAKDGLIKSKSENYVITNMAAVLLAKRLDDFSPSLARKVPRVVHYIGKDKLQTQSEISGQKGYALAFENLVEYVYSTAPQNSFIEEGVRKEVKMFPKQALRELIANALVHQDFSASGTSVMIEMYSDRVEISNPEIPPINIKRFIDENRSRNELLAECMRRLGICEEKGSGIDKVIKAAEDNQLPAPDFRVGEARTVAILFARQNFSDIPKDDRVRAAYQHCCLMYVSNQRMSNQSLRERFNLFESSMSTVSQIISDARDADLIKQDEMETKSSRYARYIPFWA